jgi:hypothetical protein
MMIPPEEHIRQKFPTSPLLWLLFGVEMTTLRGKEIMEEDGTAVSNGEGTTILFGVMVVSSIAVSFLLFKTTVLATCLLLPEESPRFFFLLFIEPCFWSKRWRGLETPFLATLLLLRLSATTGRGLRRFACRRVENLLAGSRRA